MSQCGQDWGKRGQNTDGHKSHVLFSASGSLFCFVVVICGDYPFNVNHQVHHSFRLWRNSQACFHAHNAPIQLYTKFHVLDALFMQCTLFLYCKFECQQYITCEINLNCAITTNKHTAHFTTSNTAGILMFLICVLNNILFIIQSSKMTKERNMQPSDSVFAPHN